MSSPKNLFLRGKKKRHAKCDERERDVSNRSSGGEKMLLVLFSNAI
jgi:hypothetical protein